MKDKPFHFKQFSVHHHLSSMKVGTDALLLGAWCDTADKKNILEVGCGCGVISLMLAQRNSQANIMSIDIDAPSVDEAQSNFILSPWANRLNAQKIDFNELNYHSHFDLIVSNPPFFHNALHSPVESRNNARHLLTFNRSLFFKKCNSISTYNGTIALIVPFDDKINWNDAAAANNWYPIKILMVKDTELKPNKRILIVYSKAELPIELDSIVLKKNNRFSPDYIRLLGNFQTIF